MTDADTLRMLEDAAAGLARFDAARIRGWREKPPYFDRAIWREMAAQGWLAIMVDEDRGGMGLGLDAAAVVARAIGHAACPEPFVAAGVVVSLALQSCPEGDCRNTALSEVISGETIVSLAWQGPSGLLDIEHQTAQAEVDADRIVISGESRFVPVPDADAFIVAATGNSGLGLYWLPASAPGLTIKAEPHADGGASGWLTYANVEIPADHCLAQGAQAAAVLRTAIDRGVIANCAELNGAIARALDLTLEYLKTRKQFGQAIGAFQVLQHRSVDLWIQKEMAGHVTNTAIRTAISGHPDVEALALAASSAKARVGEVARLFCNETVQLHGAIGFTDEYDLGLYVNRMLSLVPYLGNTAEHRARYGQLKQLMRTAA